MRKAFFRHQVAAFGRAGDDSIFDLVALAFPASEIFPIEKWAEFLCCRDGATTEKHGDVSINCHNV
jgi:hypothetical protein